MNQLPYRPPEGEPRELSAQQFEAVIRRAAELQARAAEEPGSAMTEAEMMRIGRELGLSPEHLGRALAEVRGEGAAEEGTLYRLFGSAAIRASRVVPGAATEVREQLETYLVQREYFRVKRRFGGRVVYEPASGVLAAIGRAATQVGGRTQPLRLPVMEVSVEALGADQSYVTVGTSLTGPRAGVAFGAAAGGVGGGGAVAVVLAIAVAPAAALVGVPVLASAYFGFRAVYAALAEKAQEQLESFLDRLEHGEIAGAVRRLPRGAR